MLFWLYIFVMNMSLCYKLESLDQKTIKNYQLYLNFQIYPSCHSEKHSPTQSLEYGVFYKTKSTEV